VKDLEELPGPCWTYHPSLRAVEIKLDQRANPTPVRLEGISWMAPRAPKTSWEFSLDSDGWMPEHSLEPFHVENGVLVTTITGEDPYMTTGDVSFDAGKFKRVRVRLKAAEAGQVQLFFGTSLHPLNADTSVDGEYTTPGQWQELVFDLASNPLWEGQVAALRLDPPGTSGRLEVDYLRLEP